MHCLTGGFPKLGVPFWGPNNKDHNILVSILVSPFLGKLPTVEWEGTPRVGNVPGG